MAIKGTLAILRTTEGGFDFLATSCDSKPYVLFIRGAPKLNADIVDVEHVEICAAVEYLTNHERCDDITIPGVGIITLAIW